MAHLELIRQRPLTRWDRFVQSMRSISLGPWNPKDPAIARMFGGGPIAAGVLVNEATALTYSAVWAAVNLIAGDISSVPLRLYRRDKNGGKTKFDTHPLYRLVHDQPNPHMGSDVFRRTLQAHKLIWGNGYAEIVRNGEGRAVELWPLLPWAVTPYQEGGELYYRVMNPNGRQVTLDAMSILHLRGLSQDGITGISVIDKGRESLGLGLAAERFGSTFFGNGSTFGGIIKYPPGLKTTQQSRDENRDNLYNRHQGVDRAHRFLALYEGAEYQQLGVPPNDAQFLETRQFQIAEVARWFGVPPHKIGDLEHATFSNIEQQSIEYVTGCLRPHFVHWEQELTRKLVPSLERSQQLIEHSMEGLLRGDAAARGAFYSQLFQIGAITQNEIREFENLNPIVGGDTPFVPLNSIPSDRLTEYIDALIESKNPPPPPPPPAPVPPPSDEPPPEVKALREAVDLARHATQLAEDTRDQARADLEQAVKIRAGLEQEIRDSAQSLLEARHELAATENRLHDAEALGQARTTEREALAADVTGLTADLAAANTARDTAQADAERQIAALTADREAALTLAAQAEQHRDAALALTTAADLQRDAARLQAGQAENDRGVAVLKAEMLQGTVTMLEADAETLRTELAQARADVATELEHQRTQKGVLLAAMRSLFVEASERLLQREIDRARKHQATPEKLRTWIDHFYPLHRDVCRAAFQPIVGPWTAVTGGAPGVLLDRLVTEHLEQSEQALRVVADAEDPDVLAATLERTLFRWEHERAEAMADALVREGMNGDGQP